MGAIQDVLTASRQPFAASGAGFMMVDENSALSVVAATDEPGRLLETRQEEIGTGPCVDCLTFDQVVTTGDLAADDRWPALVQAVSAAGVRAVLGVPVHVGGVAVGALNVYRDQPGDWHESVVSGLEAYGTLIENFLISALQTRERAELAQQLQHALDHRVVIERAVGVTMARGHVNAVDAYNQLRREARSTERKVADVAAELLAKLPTNP